MNTPRFLFALSLALPALAVGDGDKGFFDGVSLDTRTFYFDRSFDAPATPDVEALTAGGILKYQSGRFHGIGVGLGYYGSYSLSGVVDRDKGGGSALLQPDGEDISFLGEAYIDLDTGRHQLVVGRQRLATPMADDHDNRLLPSAYEAALYRYKTETDGQFEIGYIDAYTGFGSTFDGFDAPEADWGSDGLAYLYGKGEAFGLQWRAQWVQTLEDSGVYEDYGYLDANYPLDLGEGSYVRAQYGRTGYQQGDAGQMYGFKAGTRIGGVELALLLNAIRDNRFDAVEAGPMYTDWQQGYGNYEPSDALGVQLTFFPSDRSSVKFGYVDVESKDGDAFNLDTFSEFNIDAQMSFSEAARIRFRYSLKDQDNSSDRQDRNDFRVIFYYNF